MAHCLFLGIAGYPCGPWIEPCDLQMRIHCEHADGKVFDNKGTKGQIPGALSFRICGIWLLIAVLHVLFPLGFQTIPGSMGSGQLEKNCLYRILANQANKTIQ